MTLSLCYSGLFRAESDRQTIGVCLSLSFAINPSLLVRSVLQRLVDQGQGNLKGFDPTGGERVLRSAGGQLQKSFLALA